MGRVLAILALLGVWVWADIELPDGTPFTIEPTSADFLACFRGGANREDSRTFTISKTAGDKVRIYRVRVSNAADGWSVESARNIRLDADRTTGQFTVKFGPNKQGASASELSFTYRVKRGNRVGRAQVIRIDLSGTGLDCAAGDGGGGGPGVALPPAGGGADAGTPAPATDPADVTEVCVRFWKLPSASDELTEEKIDEWLAQANRIFRGSGVRFKKGSGPGGRQLQDAPDTVALGDTHCLDIFVGGENSLPNDVLGGTSGHANDEFKKKLKDDLGAHDDFREKTTIGFKIQMEEASDAGETLAHELGHALGLGAKGDLPPNAPAGTPQPHLDPQDGRPITNDGRLMRPTTDGEGTNLTDFERRVAKLGAQQVRGGPGTLACRKSSQTVPDPGGSTEDPRSDLRQTRVYNGSDALHFSLFQQRALVSPAAVVLTVEFDTDLDGFTDRQARFEWIEKRWAVTTSPPGELTYPALAAPHPIQGPPQFGEERTGREIIGFNTVVPKAFLGRESGPIGWRVKLALRNRGPGDSTPKQGFVEFDITNPRFSLSMTPARRITAERGGAVTLSGTAIQSSTFTGSVDLQLLIARGKTFESIRLGRLASPLPAEWSRSAELPRDLRPGRYEASVVGRCLGCGAQSSDSVRITVLGRKAIERNEGAVILIWVGALVLLGGVAFFLTRRRR